MKAKLSPPLENFVFIIDYALSNLSSPPKYSQKLNEIMNIISSCLKKFYFIKTPNLLCLAFYFYKDTRACFFQSYPFYSDILYTPPRQKNIEYSTTFVLNWEKMR